MFQTWVMMGFEAGKALLEEWNAAWTEVFARQLAEVLGDERRKVARAAGLRNVLHLPGATMMQ